MADYPYERQVEYWTSRAIEDYFLDSGFEVLVKLRLKPTSISVGAD